MSFDEEWAQLKAEALARRGSEAMRLNQVPEQDGGSATVGEGLAHHTESVNGSAHLLIEIAGLLHEGRPDGDLSTMAR
jgi:hypothetical protein